MVAGVGFAPHDLLVMSQVSCYFSIPLYGGAGRSRTAVLKPLTNQTTSLFYLFDGYQPPNAFASKINRTDWA